MNIFSKIIGVIVSTLLCLVLAGVIPSLAFLVFHLFAFTGLGAALFACVLALVLAAPIIFVCVGVFALWISILTVIFK